MDRAAFFNAIRALFGGKMSSGQVSGMTGILDAWEQLGDGRVTTLAYALATAYHETGARMMPVREGFASSDSAARRIVRNRRYGQPVQGQVYYGRGQVQLTWAENYKASSADAGVDLFKNPDAMLEPAISARVLIAGLIDGRWNGVEGKGIGAYLEADDLKGARRTVNGTDRWEMIAGYYRTFLEAVTAAAADVPKPSASASDDQAEALHQLVAWRAAAPDNLETVIAWLREMPR